MIGQIPDPTVDAEPHAPVPVAAGVDETVDETHTDKPGVAAPEHGGRGGLDPVRYGDWEKNGRCIDF